MAERTPSASQNIKSALQKVSPGFYRTAVDVKLRIAQALLIRQVSRIKRASSGISVLYITGKFPKQPARRREYAYGGAVKMTYLAETFPHSYPLANILYTVSSAGHAARSQIVAQAKRQGLKIIINQNGVAYPAWHGPGWEATNQDFKETLDQADYILYQSRFCQASAERFLAPPNVPSEILYNPVDTRLFVPVTFSEKPAHMTLVLGGNQRQRYRTELAIHTLKAIVAEVPDAQLIITGDLGGPGNDALIWTKNLIQELGLSDHIKFTGRYAQEQAPLIFRQAHILLHTQYNDASPTLVLEAMSSGLPVAYIQSGGVPELVMDAGVGVQVEESWDQISLPDPAQMAEAVMRVISRYETFSRIARQRAVGEFALEKFVTRHRQIFTRVLNA